MHRNRNSIAFTVSMEIALKNIQQSRQSFVAALFISLSCSHNSISVTPCVSQDHHCTDQNMCNIGQNLFHHQHSQQFYFFWLKMQMCSLLSLYCFVLVCVAACLPAQLLFHTPLSQLFVHSASSVAIPLPSVFFSAPFLPAAFLLVLIVFVLRFLQML